MKIFTTGEAARYLNVKPKTIQKYDREGKLIAHRTPTNRRYYTQEQLDDWLNLKRPASTKRKIVSYARVSANKQKESLKNQLDYIRNYTNAKGVILDEELSDIGSGLNYKRYNWNKLLKQVDQDKIEKIYVAYKDRFVRFGYEWFEAFCKDHGTNLIALNNPNVSPEKEMTDDLISIIHVFSSRIYGLRKYPKEIVQDLKKKQGD